MNEIEILDKLHLFQSQLFVFIGEDIEITYSYWDGSGHRRTLTVETCGIYFSCIMDVYILMCHNKLLCIGAIGYTVQEQFGHFSNAPTPIFSLHFKRIFASISDSLVL